MIQDHIHDYNIAEAAMPFAIVQCSGLHSIEFE